MTKDTGDELAHFMRVLLSERAAERSRLMSDMKRALLPVLVKNGVSHVVLDYDGYGDSMDYSTLTFRDSSGAGVANTLFDQEFENLLIDTMLRATPPGCEINEGGFGQVVLDVNARTMRNEHEQRHTETTHSEEEYTL